MLLDIFRSALAAVDPFVALIKTVRVEDARFIADSTEYALDLFDRILVVGAGKATPRMAAAIEQLLGDRVSQGLIVTRYGHATTLRLIEQREAGHPIPDEAGLEGTRSILEKVRSADDRTLVVCLLSGGGSSLLVQPARGISLDEKRKTTELLLKAGASIFELNAVRKHLSIVKGGRLAEAAHPAAVLTLILSDVVGNPLDVIASGPTVPDPSTFSDAAAVIEKYGLNQRLPAAVRRHIERGLRGQEAETPKGRESYFSNTRAVIVGGIALALSAARDYAYARGLSPDVVTAELQGEARDAGRILAGTAVQAARSLQPSGKRCLLSGGETTVTVRGSGAGGRSQELALAFALEIEGVPGITLLSAGTDGSDGPTQAAGAIVDGTTARAARKAGMDPRAYLENNDSYTFFKELDARTGTRSLLVTGPTGTNVMDIQIIAVEREANFAAFTSETLRNKIHTG